MKLSVVDYRKAWSTSLQKTKRNAFRKVSGSFKQFADEGALFFASKMSISLKELMLISEKSS